MAKPHRGKTLRTTPNKSRGNCPLCNRTGIKIVYEQAINEKKLFVCKQCRAALANGKKLEPITATA